MLTPAKIPVLGVCVCGIRVWLRFRKLNLAPNVTWGPIPSHLRRQESKQAGKRCSSSPWMYRAKLIGTWSGSPAPPQGSSPADVHQTHNIRAYCTNWKGMGGIPAQRKRPKTPKISTAPQVRVLGGRAAAGRAQIAFLFLFSICGRRSLGVSSAEPHAY